ncbi:fec operon regulator FecR [compost metagenome]|uniref:FecR family protein n=1 Tax=Pedobacter sp. ok626 TaxID=1761882 RepID=UPI0008820208|nr:FecR family protein [Pedobacter sp. ok626]SDL14548.1 FecR family protein [Pedobacter sp. ok626]
MEQLDARKLIQRYLNDDLSHEEQLIVEQWFAKNLEDSGYIPDYSRIIEADNRIWSNLNTHIEDEKNKNKPIRLWPRIISAAVVLFILSFITYFFLYKPDRTQQLVEIKSNDILPGKNKAILTLADGKKIFLSDAEKGIVAQQGGAEITKRGQGGLSYHVADKKSINPSLYNTMSTPRGGTYKLILEDGTQVVLNAMSSITYPTSFAGTERRVVLHGEAYFNVTHNTKKPFKVVSNGQTVQVLGTQFNVSAYKDEPTTETTLLVGSVKVTNDQLETVYLKPGQQSRGAEHLTLATDVDVNEAIAWKDGFFHFNDADVPTVMRALSRWYDVDIEYQGNPTKRRFTGDIHRDMTVSKALEVISLLKIRFRVEKKKIIVIQ